MLTEQLNFWPKAEDQPKIPHERNEIMEEMARLKFERLKRREERLLRENAEREQSR